VPWFDQSGSRIYYEEEGAGTPVLLLPGWGGRIEHLSFLRAALARDFRVIAADIPGSGRSGPQPRQYPLTYYEDDSRALLALLGHLGGAPAHLVGYSDGGEYALLMAAIEPIAVRSVVTWGAGGQLPSSPDMADWFHDLVDEPPPPLKAYSDYLREMYGEAEARLMAQSVARVWRAMIEAGGDISRSRARDIACPVKLIVGVHDDFVPLPLAEEMARAVQRGQLDVVDDADHGVHHTHREWLVQTIVDWLAKN
jgi:valacyclovir hydrolase